MQTMKMRHTLPAYVLATWLGITLLVGGGAGLALGYALDTGTGLSIVESSTAGQQAGSHSMDRADFIESLRAE